MNPSQPRWLQYATWLVYWGALWALVAVFDSRVPVFSGDTPIRVRQLVFLTVLQVPLAVFGGSEMAMGKRRGYYMCLAFAASQILIRYLEVVGQASPLTVMRYALIPLDGSMSSLISFGFEVFLWFCLLHPTSRNYAKVWLDD